MSKDLAIAEDNAEFLLEQRITAVAAGDRSGGAYFSISRQYRTLALCKLLGEADVASFVQLLAVSAQPRIEFLTSVASGFQEDDQRVLCLSKDRGFESALASGDLTSARRIAELAPVTYYERVEYRDDYLFALIQRQIFLRELKAVAQEVGPLVDELAAEAPEPESPTILLARGLNEGSTELFTEGIRGLLQARRRRAQELKGRSDAPQELLLTEGAVSVEGLGLLRLGELRGLVHDDPLPLIPRIARVPIWPPERRAHNWLRNP